MEPLIWSSSEKLLSRRLFDAALQAELGEIMDEFRSKAAAATAAEMWELESYLAHKRREIDEKYDYRYSRLIWVFGRLVREGRLREEQLHGLSADKLAQIQRVAAL